MASFSASSVRGCAMPFDSTPHLSSAGQGNEQCDESTEQTLKPEIFDRAPPTPDYLKKWRKNHEPGTTCLHPGYAEDEDYKQLNVYGKAEPVGVKVHEIMNTAPKSYLLEQAERRKEEIYYSSKREPLGKPFVRGHEIPDKMVQQGFGMPTPQDLTGDETKNLMHPREQLYDAKEHGLYVRSHANYAPGEQRHRDYVWRDKDGVIDPSRYAFGRSIHKPEVDGVAKTLAPKPGDGGPGEIMPNPLIVEKKLEDWREVKCEPLGRVKSVGHGNRTEPDKVFGMPSQKVPEWGVQECIANYPREQQEPDNDLGRSIRPGWRNIADPNRSFGVPSIRDDVPAPTLKSVADHQNYGDESNAGALLYPPRFSDQGITQVDFLLARSQEQMISLFKNAGFDLTEEQLANTFTKAASLDPQGRVSVESFRRTLNESM